MAHRDLEAVSTRGDRLRLLIMILVLNSFLIILLLLLRIAPPAEVASLNSPLISVKLIIKCFEFWISVLIGYSRHQTMGDA